MAKKKGKKNSESDIKKKKSAPDAASSDAQSNATEKEEARRLREEDKAKAKEEKERKRLEREKEREERRKAKEEEKQRRAEEKQRLTEEAAKEMEDRRRHISTHRFEVLSGADTMTRLSAYRGELDDEVDPLFNKLVGKMNLIGADVAKENELAFGDAQSGDIATVNAALEQIKSFETSVARLLEAGMSPEGLIDSGVSREAVDRLNSIRPGHGRKNLGRFVRQGGIRNEIIDSTEADKPHVFTEFMKGRADEAKESLARYKDSQESTKTIQKEHADEAKEQDRTERANVRDLIERRKNLSEEYKANDENEEAARALRGDYDSRLSMEENWQKYSDEETSMRNAREADRSIERKRRDEENRQHEEQLNERRRNLAAEYKDRGSHEDAARAMRGDYDEMLSTEAAWDKYSDSESTVRRGAQADEKARQDEERRMREEEEKRAKSEQKQRQDWLNERRRNLAAELKSQGRNEDAAKAMLGVYDQTVIEGAGRDPDYYSDKQSSIRRGQKADRDKEEEERRNRALEEENELNRKRSLYADIKSYEAEAAGGRMSAVERLGIVTGSSGRDTEFSDKSVSDLELLLAKAKDKAVEADTSGSSEEQMEQMEQIRSMRRLIKLVTGINVSSGQMKMWMGRMKGAGIDVGGLMNFAGPLARGILASIGIMKAAYATHEDARAASKEMTEHKWTAEQMGISKEQVAQESIAARRYGVTGEDLLKSRSKVAQGIAQLKTQNDNSFFKPLWQAGFSSQNVNTVEDFEKRLSEFLNDPNKTQEQKISVMRSLGRSEKEYEYAKNRNTAMSQVSDKDVKQAVIADEKTSKIAEARNKINADYEARKTQIDASDSFYAIKWIKHLSNWWDKFQANSGLTYDEKTNNVYRTNISQHPLVAMKRMDEALGIKGPNDKYLEAEVNRVMRENAILPMPPSVADVEKATAEVSSAAQGSQTQETNNNTTVNATYNITGSKQDAEAIRNAVDDANNKLAADISNSSTHQEIGGR